MILTDEAISDLNRKGILFYREEAFLKNCMKQLAAGRTLSDKQIRWIDKIETRAARARARLRGGYSASILGGFR